LFVFETKVYAVAKSSGEAPRAFLSSIGEIFISVGTGELAGIINVAEDTIYCFVGSFV
jgi:hypothetical protein